jgi:dTDP-4-amino-4,6-dideoxygalactose transaminase
LTELRAALSSTLQRLQVHLRLVRHGHSLSYDGLYGRTLDREDVRLAREELAQGRADVGATARFEEAIQRWNGSRWAYAFTSGREAFNACLFGLGLKPGDEVIIPAYTCVAVINALRIAGLVPVWSDIELDTYGLDQSDLERRVTPRTRAVVIQHLFGLVSRDFQANLAFCKENSIATIEDCAHATGAVYKGTKVGNFADCAFFSSEHSKILTTVRGGWATTNDPVISRGMATYRDQCPFPPQDWVDDMLTNLLIDYYDCASPSQWILGDLFRLAHFHRYSPSSSQEVKEGQTPEGYGRRMPGALARIGLRQLERLDQFNALRRDKAQDWEAWCKAKGYAAPMVVEGSTPVFLRYPVLMEPAKKASTLWAQKELGIQAGVWFLGSAHPLPGVAPGCPNAAEAVARCVNLPCL